MRRFRLPLLAAVAGSLAACAVPDPAPALQPVAAPQPSRFTEEGIASWYGPGWSGRKTASGERFDPRAMTAAHPTLPLGTKVRVTNLENGRSVTLRINDRGPHSSGDRRRILDVSARAAASLGMKKDGVAPVRLETILSGEEAASERSGAD